MKSTLNRLSVIGLILLAPSLVEAQAIAELDAYWTEVAGTVEEGDFEGYSRLYHPDAVLVNMGSRTSYPIAQALAEWKQGFVDTREGRAHASVTFRFTRRIHDDATAHETGIFRYALKPEGGNETVSMVHFEGLLVRKDGAWLMVMEYQKQPATGSGMGDREVKRMKASPQTKVRQMYDETADTYSDMMDREIDLPVYTDILSRLANRIRDVTGPVVDTSCGSGHMLSMYRERYDPGRLLVGVDLSPRMVAIASPRLGSGAEVLNGDMRDLQQIAPGTSAAVLSFFAIHHLGAAEILPALEEWGRALCPGGQLLVAAWEGTGAIDYGTESDVVAFRYTRDQIVEWAEAAGFTVDRCVVEPVEDMPMDAVYLEGTLKYRPQK